MAQPVQTYGTLITNVGAAAFVNAQAAGTDVSMANLVVGDGNGNPVTPSQAQTALVNQVWSVPITSVTQDPVNTNQLIVEAVIPASVGGFTVRELGIKAADGTLLFVGNFPATEKPVLAQGVGRDLNLKMVVVVGSAASVTLTIDPSVVLATNQAIANAIAAHEAKTDPHPQYLTKAEADAFYDVLGAANLPNILAQLRGDRARRYYNASGM